MTDAEARWISVTGEGEASVEPDVAVVTLTVSARAENFAAAKDDANARTSAVLARLRELAVVDTDVQAPGLAVHPEIDHRRGDGRVIGYRASRSITVRVRNLDALGGIIDGVVAAGANEMHGAQMVATDSAAAEHAALSAAVAAARAKASAVADAAGLRVGAPIRIEEEAGHDSPMPLLRSGLAEAGGIGTEIAPGELVVRRRVRAWFSLA